MTWEAAPAPAAEAEAGGGELQRVASLRSVYRQLQGEAPRKEAGHAPGDASTAAAITADEAEAEAEAEAAVCDSVVAPPPPLRLLPPLLCRARSRACRRVAEVVVGPGTRTSSPAAAAAEADDNDDELPPGWCAAEAASLAELLPLLDVTAVSRT